MSATPAAPRKRWFLRLPVILLMIGIGVGQVLLALVFLRSVPADETHAEAGHGEPTVAEQHGEPSHVAPSHDEPAPGHAAHSDPAHSDSGHHETSHHEQAPHAPVAADPLDSHGSHGAHDPHAVEAEVDLGNFALTIPPTKEHPTLLVTFHIYGTIDEHHAGEFNERHDAYRHRIRQEVLTLVRQSDMQALGDPDFSTLKKQMLERINRVLGSAALSHLVFSDFAILEH
jgi:hypothetical protein